MSGMKIADFLKYQNRTEKKQYLRGWKESDAHAVNVWLHTKSDIYPIWRHQFPEVVPFEDKETKEKSKRIFSKRLVCHESEHVLRRQNYRNRATGERETPPVACPICRLIEHVRELVDNQEIDISEPVFRFEGTRDGQKETLTLHAGGLYGFGKDISDTDKAKLKRAGIYLSQAWKENIQARINYIFAVVDNEDVEAGVQVAVESSLLGDRVRKVIQNCMTSLGEEEGNPSINPYAIRWTYNPKEGVPFGEKYDAIAMPKIALKPAVKKLIVEDPPPDVSELLEKFNIETIKARMQQHAVYKFDWSAIFPSGKAAPKVEIVPEVVTPEDPVDLVACDECERPMLETDPKCNYCGKVYLEEAKAPLPVAMKKRSEAVQTSFKAEEALDDTMDELPF